MFGTGIDSTYEVYKEAMKAGVFNKSGAWYRIKGEEDPVAQGEVNVVKWISENLEMVQKLIKESKDV